MGFMQAYAAACIVLVLGISCGVVAQPAGKKFALLNVALDANTAAAQCAANGREIV